MTFELTSPDFEDGRGIPTRHTCEGRDVSPALEWRGQPAGTKALALVVDDPDAPDPKAPKMTWVHWVVYDLPPTSRGLRAGVKPKGLPAGARHGKNDWKRTGYGGPCPPIGTHRYFFKLYALDVLLGDLGRPTKAELEAKMDGHILARATRMGTYLKKR